MPHQPYYETFWQKLAAMVRSVAANHALVDGNKRLAHTVLHTTLIVNGYVWMWSQQDGETLILRLATGDTAFEWLAEFLGTWAVGEIEIPQDADAATLVAALEQARQMVFDQRQDPAELLLGAITRHARGQLPRALLDAFRKPKPGHSI